MSVTGATTEFMREAESTIPARHRTNGHPLPPRRRSGPPLLVFARRHRLLADCVASALVNAGLEVARLEPSCDDVERRMVRDHPLIVVDSVVLDETRSGLVNEIRECGANVLVVAADPTHAAGVGWHSRADVVAATDDLVTLVHAVHRLLWRTEHHAGSAEVCVGSDEPRELLALLTPREQTVLDCMMHGLSAVEIAEVQFVAVTTVRSQIRSILNKLNVRSQLAAVAVAHEADWRADDRRIHQI